MGTGKRVGKTQETLKIEGWLARWLIAFGFYLLQVWARTLRYEVDDRAGVVGRPVTENYIGALWHNRLLILPFVLRRFFSNRHGAALISASRDGDLLADAIQRFGYDVVRGSSSRLGASAVRQLNEVLASGRDVVITPDGPRGPAYELGPGIIFLAQKIGCSSVADESGILAVAGDWEVGTGSSCRDHLLKCACLSARRIDQSDYYTGGI